MRRHEQPRCDNQFWYLFYLRGKICTAAYSFTSGLVLAQLPMASAGNIFTHRLWGLIPLLLFALKAWQYRAPQDQAQLLWFCNAATFCLAIAIFLRWGNAVFVCSGLLLVGLPIWLFDVFATGDFHIFSVFTHVVGPLLGALVVRQLGASRHAIWQALLFYVLLQLAARLLTAPAFNINVLFVQISVLPAGCKFTVGNGLTIIAAGFVSKVQPELFVTMQE